MLCQAEALLCPAEERELGFACVAVQAVQAESVDKLVNTRDLRTGDPTTRWPITRPSHTSIELVSIQYISSYIYGISHLILLYMSSIIHLKVPIIIYLPIYLSCGVSVSWEGPHRQLPYQ